MRSVVRLRLAGLFSCLLNSTMGLYNSLWGSIACSCMDVELSIYPIISMTASLRRCWAILPSRFVS